MSKKCQKNVKKNLQITKNSLLLQILTKTLIIMKKLYLLIGIIMVYCLLAVAMSNKIVKDKTEGKWEVKIADAPYGYRDLVVDLKWNKGGAYNADIYFVDSKDIISNQEFTMKDGKLASIVHVDNKLVKISAWEEKGVVKGTAVCPLLGALPISFSRQKE